jgi:uncharacterized protein YegP (UPF0339 family)
MFRTFSLASFVIALVGLSAAARPDSKMTFELYKGKNDQYRWRLKDGDNTVATGGQGYKAKADAKRGIASVQKLAANSKANFEVYEDDAKNQRWRLKATNGQTIASSSGSFKTKAEAEKAVAAVKAGAAKAEIIELK